MQQPQCQIQALLQAAGVGACLLVGPIGEFQQFNHLLDAIAGHLGGQVIQIRLELQQFASGQHFIQRHILGNVAQTLARDSRIVQNGKTVNFNLACVRRAEGAKAANGGRFACPIRP